MKILWRSTEVKEKPVDLQQLFNSFWNNPEKDASVGQYQSP